MAGTRCEQCRATFEPVRGWQRFCSPQCQRKAALTRYDQARREAIIADYLKSVSVKEKTSGKS